jgi:hypothetical protein
MSAHRQLDRPSVVGLSKRSNTLNEIVFVPPDQLKFHEIS